MTLDEALEHAEAIVADSHTDGTDYEDRASIALAVEVKRLREASRITAVNFVQAQQDIARLKTDDWKLRMDLKTACENAAEFNATARMLRSKLARIEALCDEHDEWSFATVDSRDFAEKIRAAARDQST